MRQFSREAREDESEARAGLETSRLMSCHRSLGRVPNAPS